MPLSDYKVPTYEWQIGMLPPDENGEEKPDIVLLYGLSLPELTTLLNAHREKIMAFVGVIQDEKSGLQKLGIKDGAEIGEALLAGVPDIAADIIALGAHDPDQGPMIALMPFPLQMDALDAVITLTFHAISQKKILALLTKIVAFGANLTQESARSRLRGLSQ